MLHRLNKKAILRWLPAVTLMASIFWFSSQPDLPGPENNLLDLLFKKSAHFTVYGALALCYLLALGDWQKKHVALVLAILYAISDEYHQSWTPLRNPAWADVLIDIVGAVTALWLVAPYLKQLLQKQLEVWLAVPPKQMPERPLHSVNRFVAEPKTEQSADD